ncbi:hypothetical protein B484DRAFT_426020, partial [Ochromonadaceae sp. CCMP2298]
ITYHLSPITYHLSPITYHLSPITYSLSAVFLSAQGGALFGSRELDPLRLVKVEEKSQFAPKLKAQTQSKSQSKLAERLAQKRGK